MILNDFKFIEGHLVPLEDVIKYRLDEIYIHSIKSGVVNKEIYRMFIKNNFCIKFNTDVIHQWNKRIGFSLIPLNFLSGSQ